jgi:hypothetical protein
MLLRALTIASLLALCFVGVPSAQQPDPQLLGPGVGERVPDFSLPDQHGIVRTLRSTLGPKGGVLVFFRSADW